MAPSASRFFRAKPLLETARRLRVDMVLVVQLLWVLPETIAELRSQGIVCAGWFPDAFTSFAAARSALRLEWALFQDRFMGACGRACPPTTSITCPSAWIACSTAQLT